MRSFHHPDHALHAPQFFLIRGEVRPNYEIPARAAALLEGLHALGLRPEATTAADPTALTSVHAPDYLVFLAEAAAEWAKLPQKGPELVANTHPPPEALAQGGRRPDSIIGQVGWYTADLACPIGPGTWTASLGAAGCALAAAAEVASGGTAYALCRPPGHHTYPARAGGHCYLNNAALAVEHLRRSGAARIAVLDIDSHHGNGTQGCFWERADVLTISIHADPNRYYPWFCGHAEERGGGLGTGCNQNHPLPFGTSDAAWLATIADSLSTIRAFGAEALVVSLGFDASIHEPLNALAISNDGFARAGAAIAGLKLPSAIIQEGGYAVDHLSILLQRFLTGWSEG
jgi:acetoin utilization deacetylase AcuC-like enzyme